MRRIFPVVGGIAVVILGGLGWAFANFGSLHDAWLFANGVRAVIEPKALNVGEGRGGESRDAAFRVRNLTSQPVTILGATVACSCVTCDKLPVTIAPRSALDLGVSFHFEGRDQVDISQGVTYHTDHPTVPTLKGIVRGRVLGDSTAASRPGQGEVLFPARP